MSAKGGPGDLTRPPASISALRHFQYLRHELGLAVLHQTLKEHNGVPGRTTPTKVSSFEVTPHQGWRRPTVIFKIALEEADVSEFLTVEHNRSAGYYIVPRPWVRPICVRIFGHALLH